MKEGVEETGSGRNGKLLEPSLYHHNPKETVDADAVDEDVEATGNKGWVEFSKFRCCCEVFESYEVDKFVQGCLEDPRDALQIQRNCALIQIMCLRDVGKPVICTLAK